MATALSVSPVPFDDDGYAEYQLEQCRHDQNRFDQVLTIISILAAATVFFQRIRNKEHRKFPDNIFTMSLVSLCGIHLALLISIASKNKLVLLDDNPWRSLCHLQATMFHWCACAAIWNIICVIVTLHRVIVYKVAVADLVHYSRAYYLSLVLLPSIAVGACWSFGGGYGPYPGLHNCWIKPGAGRLLFFHSFTILGFTSFLALGPPTVLALWRAYHNASQATSASLFKSLMLRHVLLAIYGLAVVTAFLLGGLNNMLLSSHKDSTYIKRSAYPICIFSAINFASLGLFVSLIYWSTKHQTQVIRDTINKVVNLSWCARPTTHKMDEDECPLESIEVHHKMPEPIVKLSARHAPLTISTVRLSPRNSTASECEFRSAFDSAARSITSIPPDPQHRRAKEIATNAYTSTLLEYVREQLLDELNGEDSDWSESSAYDDDLSSRASELSMEELLSHTESSYPASPLSNFHEFSPCHAARSPDSEELARRATITDL